MRVCCNVYSVCFHFKYVPGMICQFLHTFLTHYIFKAIPSLIRRKIEVEIVGHWDNLPQQLRLMVEEEGEGDRVGLVERWWWELMTRPSLLETGEISLHGLWTELNRHIVISTLLKTRTCEYTTMI